MDSRVIEAGSKTVPGRLKQSGMFSAVRSISSQLALGALSSGVISPTRCGQASVSFTLKSRLTIYEIRISSGPSFRKTSIFTSSPQRVS